MEKSKKLTNTQNAIIIQLYARLKNLVYDDIPKVVWEKKYNIPSDIPKKELFKFQPE